MPRRAARGHQAKPRRGGPAERPILTVLVLGILLLAALPVPTGGTEHVDATDGPDEGNDREKKALATSVEDCENCVSVSSQAPSDWHPFGQKVAQIVEGDEVAVVGKGSNGNIHSLVFQEEGAEGDRVRQHLHQPGGAPAEIVDTVVADFDGDGVDEIGVLGKRQVDGQTRYEVTQYEHATGFGTTIRIEQIGTTHVTAGDLDGDGASEIIVLTLQPLITVFDGRLGAMGVNPETGKPGWRDLGTVPVDLPLGTTDVSLATARLDRSGADRLVMAYTNSDGSALAQVVGLVEGKGLVLLGTIDSAGTDPKRTITASMIGGWPQVRREKTMEVTGNIHLVPLGVDTNGDGIDEIVLFKQWIWWPSDGPPPQEEWTWSTHDWYGHPVFRWADHVLIYRGAPGGWSNKPLEHVTALGGTCRFSDVHRAAAGNLDADPGEEFACRSHSTYSTISIYDDETGEFRFIDQRQPPWSATFAIADLARDDPGRKELYVASGVNILRFTLDDQRRWHKQQVHVGAMGENGQMVVGDFDGDGMVAEWTGRHDVIITNPRPLAVFATPPIVAGSGQTPGKTVLTLSESTCNQRDRMQFLDVSLGAGVASPDKPIPAPSWEFLFKLSLSEEAVWTDSLCVTDSRLWTTQATTDSVLFDQTPVDIYYYKVLSSPTSELVGKDMSYAIKGRPGTWLWEVEDYNRAVDVYNKQIPSLRAEVSGEFHPAARLPRDIFLIPDSTRSQHAFGDPTTYPSDSDRQEIQVRARAAYKQVDEPVTSEFASWRTSVGLRDRTLGQQAAAFTWNSSLSTVPLQTGWAGVAISREQLSSESVSWKIGAGFDTSAKIGVVKVAFSLLAGYGEGYTVSTSEGRAIQAEVPNIPDKDTWEDHRYQWGLFVYPRDVAGHTVSVINYWVQEYMGGGPILWVEDAPYPKEPGSAAAVGPNVALRWAHAPNAVDYEIEVVDTDPTRLEPVIVAGIVPGPFGEEGAYELDEPMEPNRVYEWRVRGIDPQGKSGPWSPPTRFAVVEGPQEAPRILAARIAGDTLERPVAHALGTPHGPPVLVFSAGVQPENGGDQVWDASARQEHGTFLGANGTLPIVAGEDETEPDAFVFDGVDDLIVTARSIEAPGPGPYTVSAWINTTTPGGKILGYESSRNASSPQYDRHLYLDETGNVSFGMWDPVNGRPVVLTSYEPVTDGRWHHVAGTFDGQLVRLFVDGVDVLENERASGSCDARTVLSKATCSERFMVRTEEAYEGWWRVGGGNLRFWPGFSGTTNFTGKIAHVMVHDRALSPQEIGALVPVYAPQASMVELQWSEVEGYGYQDLGGAEDYAVLFEGRTSDAHDHEMRAGRAAGASGTPTTWDGPMEPGLYWVKVSALNAAGQGPWSPPRPLAVPVPADSAPKIAASQGAATGGTDGDEANDANDANATKGGMTTNVSWTPVREAKRYHVQVASSDDFNGTLAYEGETSTAWWLASSLPAGDHQVRVRAVGNDGPGPWSEPTTASGQPDDGNDGGDGDDTGGDGKERDTPLNIVGPVLAVLALVAWTGRRRPDRR